jgi:hypothetical protein
VSGAGVKGGTANGTYLTPRRTYRHEIAAVDANVAAVSEVIDLRKDDPAETNDGGNKSKHGSDAVLFLAAVLTDITSLTVQLWMNAVEEAVGTAGDVEEPARGGYVKVDEKTVTGNELMTFAGLPAGEYKAVVSAITAGGGPEAILLEQHSA